jgi:citrate lyase subunit beta/citryl-CoA lyase
MVHPRDVLLGAQAVAVSLPVCDHYCGVEARIKKSLQLQAELTQEFGSCVFDVTLDCEDGAPVGGEVDHANMVVSSINTAYNATKIIAINAPDKTRPRIAARVHALDHPAFETDIEIIVTQVGHHLAHVMIPKVESVADVEKAIAAIDAANKHSLHPIPIHVLLESPKAIHHAFDIAAHPRVQSISFGLMDFVSSHGGAIPASAMGVSGQFEHPLVVRAKLAISSACHAHGKVPSHCVVTEFSDAQAIQSAASKAAKNFGYTRMWSIHPSQIRPIIAAFAPDEAAIDEANLIIAKAKQADWAPINVKGVLHDRASYRFYWQVLERAHQTGKPLDASVAHYF